MTPEFYRNARKARGTQAAVAEELDVQRETIARRETGATPITTEAWLALLALPKWAQETSCPPTRLSDSPLTNLYLSTQKMVLAQDRVAHATTSKKIEQPRMIAGLEEQVPAKLIAPNFRSMLGAMPHYFNASTPRSEVPEYLPFPTWLEVIEFSKPKIPIPVYSLPHYEFKTLEVFFVDWCAVLYATEGEVIWNRRIRGRGTKHGGLYLNKAPQGQQARESRRRWNAWAATRVSLRPQSEKTLRFSPPG